MTTVYNLLNPTEPTTKGIVEVFNMYDYNHYLISLDGKSIDLIETNDYESFLLEYKFIKKALKTSGVQPNELLFVHYEFELFARKLVDYDMNNYGYKEIYLLINNHIAQSHELHETILYRGIELN